MARGNTTLQYAPRRAVRIQAAGARPSFPGPCPENGLTTPGCRARRGGASCTGFDRSRHSTKRENLRWQKLLPELGTPGVVLAARVEVDFR